MGESEKAMELRLRALHDLIPAAQDFPDFIHPYLFFIRFLRERLHPVGASDLRLIETAGGLRFRVDLGDRLGSDFYYGFYAERLESELFLALLAAAGVVLDVGANFGYYAVSSAKKVGPKGAVYAFEPDPAAFRLLAENVQLNGLGNVHSRSVCVGDADGTADFYLMEESAFSSMSHTGRARLRERVTVPKRSLDSLLGEAAVGPVSAIKIDVEGHDFAVLRGARQTIARSPEVVLTVEVNAKNLDLERRAALEATLRDLYDQGFSGWVVDPNPEGLRAAREPLEAASLGSANLFLVRSGSDSEVRLRGAARELRLRAFQTLSVDLGLDGESLLRRNAADPHHGLNLHAALLGAVLRDREARAEVAAARHEGAERESRARLDEIRRLADKLEAVEQDSQARLEEIRRLADKLEAVEQDSQARLEEIRRRDDRLQAVTRERDALRQEVEQWKREAALPLPVVLWRRLRRAWFGPHGA